MLETRKVLGQRLYLDEASNKREGCKIRYFAAILFLEGGGCEKRQL